MEFLDLTPSPRILEVLGEIKITPAQAVCELIDNSIDDLLSISRQNPEARKGIIRIDVEKLDGKAWLLVDDNGRGMSSHQLEMSLKAGYSGKDRHGSLGLFGVGFNIATASLGLTTEVYTSSYGDTTARKVKIDLRDLQRRGTFQVPIEHVALSEVGSTGTQIRVLLNEEMQAFFSRPKNLEAVREQLGRVYSYILRSDVPGLLRSEMSGAPSDISLTLGSKAVRPRMPCLWSDARETTRYGRTINAVQYVDRFLTEAVICLSCGQWHRVHSPLVCEGCGSNKLAPKERHVKGWLGVQRYLDTSDYGIDLLRNGRVIVQKYKGFFDYSDPDTGQKTREYPIEMPANRGRIVGELHLDHIPVNFTKTDFERTSRDWAVAEETIRGTSKLNRRFGGDEEIPPLSLLYMGFRRNDPGLNYLTPGNGERAMHEAAKNWGMKFHDGDPAYLTDVRWYEAAASHDAQEEEPDGAVDAGVDLDIALPDIHLPSSPERDGSEFTTNVPPKKPLVETQSEVIQRLEAVGKKKLEFCTSVQLSSVPGKWDIELWTTPEPFDLLAKSQPAKCFVVKGNFLKCFVNTKHSLFMEFGRQHIEAGLMEISATMSQLSAVKEVSNLQLYYELLMNFGDERRSEGTILDRITDLQIRLNNIMLSHVRGDAEFWWGVLEDEVRVRCERNAAASHAGVPWADLLSTGRFALCFDCFCYARLIRDWPQQMLDGFLFSPTWSGFDDVKARQASVEPLARALDFLSEFKDRNRPSTSYENQQAALYLSLLNEKMVDQS